MYKEYCTDGLVPYPLPQYKFREELKTYFRGFKERHDIGGERIRSWYYDFVGDEFTSVVATSSSGAMELSERESLLDDLLSGCKAQYANVRETPSSKWDLCSTTLGELDTTRLHYVQPPTTHIVIDFDLRDETGTLKTDSNRKQLQSLGAYVGRLRIPANCKDCGDCTDKKSDWEELKKNLKKEIRILVNS